MVDVEAATWLLHFGMNGAVATALPLEPYVPGHKILLLVVALLLVDVSDVSEEGDSAGCYFGSS